MPERFTLKLDDLTIGDIEEIEAVSEVPFDQLLAPDKPKGKALRVIAYVLKRREDPEFTLEQAGDLIITEAAPDPTPPAE